MKQLTLSFVILVSITAYGQQEYSFAVIAGQYSMKDMKNIQDEQLNTLIANGLPVKKELSFPASLQAEFAVDRQLNKEWLRVGGFINYAITRGTLGYSDYSGEVKANQDVSRVAIGGRIRRIMHRGIEFYGKLGFNYNMLDMSFHQQLNGEPPEDENYKFHSLGVLFEPGIGWSRSLGKAFIRLHAGYELNLNGKTYLNDDSNSYLLTPAGKKAEIDWQGLRVGAGIGIRL